jgi:hypothetical protein
VVLLLGAAGYLWFTQMYKPAVTDRDSATASATSAEGELQKAKADLAAAQQQADQAKDEAAKPDDSVQRVMVAHKAIPQKELVDDAAIVLVDLANQAGISTDFSSSSDSDAISAEPAAGGSLQGATPIDLTFEAAGTYQEMLLFMTKVEGTVSAKHGKLYAKDRLFNVVSLQIGSKGDDDSGSTPQLSSDGSGTDGSGPTLGPNDMLFTVTVRMYTSSTDNAESVGASTPDPAAAPTDGSGATTDGSVPTDGTGTTGSTPEGAATPSDGPAGQASTDPAAAGAGASSTGGSF